MKTICAIATGLVNCAIHIIRVSGDNAFEIVNKITKNEIKKEGFIIQRNYIMDNKKIIDDVLLNTFVAPKSYTGEDLIEINCHGGVFVAKKIINLLIKNGCELAKNGEFSQRALLNKKISYQQIEAINNLIYATNDDATSIAINSVLGKDIPIIEELKDQIFNIIGTLEVNIDYPEYDDVKQLSNEDIIKTLKNIQNKLKKILDDSYKIQPIIRGLNVAIIGAPNVGKSSLLNLLSNKEKAIVSNIKGTTRDIVESEIIFDGIKLNLIDTAGIRKTKNKIEQLGIKKSYEAIDNADIIIHLKDSLNDSFKIPNEINKDKIIEVYNKADIKKIKNKINISVKNNDISELLKSIQLKIKKIDYSKINNLILQSDRQFEIIKKILYLIDEIIIELKNNIPLDLVIQKIELILNEFNSFLGKTLQYDKLDEMFKKFCLGK